MATPQVAGLAIYMLSIDTSLSPQKIKEILLATSQAIPGIGGGCSAFAAAPAIDAYAAILALDKTNNAPVRKAILDIAGGNPAELGENGQFDENDLIYYIEQIETGSAEKRQGTENVKYSRADLNGDGNEDVVVGTGTFYHTNSPSNPTAGFILSAYGHNGGNIAGWQPPKSLNGTSPGSPAPTTGRPQRKFGILSGGGGSAKKGASTRRKKMARDSRKNNSKK